MNHQNIFIRESDDNDLLLLAQFRWQLCTDDAETHNSLQKNNFVAQFCTEMKTRQAKENLYHYLAEVGGKVAGVVTLILITKIPSPDLIKGYWGYITNVYVQPEYRNKGIGSQLLQHVKHICWQNDTELLVVWPSERSCPFYQRQGFRSENREQDPLVLVIGE